MKNLRGSYKSVPLNFVFFLAEFLKDVGGSIPSNIVIKDCPSFSMELIPVCNTSVSECMRLHLGDILEFLTDFHTLAKIKVCFSQYATKKCNR